MYKTMTGERGANGDLLPDVQRLTKVVRFVLIPLSVGGCKMEVSGIYVRRKSNYFDASSQFNA